MLPQLLQRARQERGAPRHGHPLPALRRGPLRHLAFAAYAAVALFLFGTGADAEIRPLTVSAASSLMDVLPKVAAAWKNAGGTDIQFNFDASSKLAAQVDHGAPVDLFIGADADWANFLAKKELIDPATRANLLTNELVIVVPTQRPGVSSQPSDLGRPEVAHVALAGENVPAGKYAREALTYVGVWPKVAPKVVNGANVRQTLQLAARGDVDAAIVYRTDALSEPRVRIVFTFDASTHAPIVYPAAVIRGAAHAAEAARFLAFCRSEAAQRLFKEAGFISLPVKR